MLCPTDRLDHVLLPRGPADSPFIIRFIASIHNKPFPSQFHLLQKLVNMAPTQQQQARSMAFIPTSCASDYMIVATAILAVTFMASEVYRRNDFIFGEVDLMPSLSSASASVSLSPGLRAGKSIIENSSLFPDGVYTRSGMPMFDAMAKAENKLQSGDAAHIGHPCTRFVSAFKYIGSESATQEEKEWAKENVKSMSIDEFVIQLDNDPQLHYKNLFRPMSEAFFDEGEFQFEEVVCQESTSLALQRISAFQSRPMPASFFGTPLDVDAHATCEGLTDEAKKVIDKLYKRDYCIFGYDKMPAAVQACNQAKMTKDVFTQRYADCVAAEEKSGEEGDLIVHVWKE
ncbi:hypothetical protein ACHAWO_012204 [Cyclotella atomus]|uniref:Uncharacterized protein n=1 Tax=Cyclotella atomus TaxID=382360 RepID=A0ABD3PFD4_9STRA